MEDWATESTQIYRIITNSHITIAAHKAESVKAGCLWKQERGEPTYQAEF